RRAVRGITHRVPVRPEQRAGHDVALRVRIDTGGPGITQLDSSSHEIVRDDAPSDRADGLPRRTAIALKTGATIPNRDFRLAWRLSSDRIEEATLTHTGNYGDGRGGFFSLILQPPARVADAEARPRELIFVLDSSGSMSGAGLADRSAIDAARDIIRAALDTMRPDDRFNVISFNNTVDVLWDAPRAGNRGNRDEARRYVDARQGGGGTEMRAAVLRALRDRRDDDDDGRMRIVVFLTDGLVSNDAAIIDAIREHAHATRVFTIGMSHAPNRHLLDEMARVGRGAADYALPADDVEPIVERFVGRIATPVLTDIELSFAGVEVTDVLPSRGQMPDLFDVQPLVIHGRYREPGRGTLTITGRTGAGRYERSIDVTLPEVQPGHDTIATLWARERVGELMRDGGGERMTDPDRIARIVRLGERFQLVTHHTSFVAVERQRVTIAGQPMLVRVPIEFPRGMSWQGVFGDRREGEQLGDEVTAGDAVQWFAAEPARREMVVRQRAAQGVPAADHLSMAQQPVMRELRESVAVRAAGTGGGGRGRLDMVADGDDAVSVAGLAHMFNRPSGEVAQPVGELAGGVSLVAVMLRGVDRDDTTGRLRVLLGDGADANEDKPVPIGRVIALNGQAGLILVLPESLAAAVRPSAEALARDGVTAAERDAAIAGLFDALERELPDIRREMELRRRLEASLHEQLGEAGPNRREAVRVTVLLDDVAPATLDTLRDAGFVHEATAPAASFVVGRINLDRLEAMALIDAVRRIESVR
ncbi:MAG: VWA domain-containing protein, partial [Phycisphaeraceae bacterium]